MKINPDLRKLVAFIFLLGVVGVSQAQSLYWDTNGATAGTTTTGSFAWDSGTNWSTSAAGTSATIGWIDGRPVVFSAGTTGTGLLEAIINGTVLTNSITFEENATFTITGGVISNGGNNLTIINNGANAKVIGSVITGAGSLTKEGSNNLYLTGANTYAGGTTITAGTLFIGNGGTTGSIVGDVATSVTTSILAFNRSNDVTFSNVLSGAGQLRQAGAGTLTVTGTHTNTGITTVSTGILKIGAGGISGSLGAGNITNNAALVYDRSDDITVANIIGGTGSFTKLNNNILTLGGANTYTGETVISAGILRLGAANRIHDSSTVSIASGATLDLNNFNEGIGDLAGSGTVSLGTGSLSVGGTGSTTFSGSITGTGIFTKKGTASILTLHNASVAHTGSTAVTAGTLILSGSTSLATSSSVSLSGVTSVLDISASDADQTIKSLSGVAAASVLLGDLNLIIDPGTNQNFQGVISGNGGLIKRGTGTQMLSGDNTYTGGTTLSGGTLNIGNGGLTGSVVGNISTASGTVLQFNRSNDYDFAGNITGNGRMTKTGAGTFTAGGDLNLSSSTASTNVVTVSAGKFVSDGAVITNTGTGGSSSGQGISIGGTGSAELNNLTVTTTHNGAVSDASLGASAMSAGVAVNTAGASVTGSNWTLDTYGAGLFVNAGGSASIDGFDLTMRGSNHTYGSVIAQSGIWVSGTANNVALDMSEVSVNNANIVLMGSNISGVYATGRSFIELTNSTLSSAANNNMGIISFTGALGGQSPLGNSEVSASNVNITLTGNNSVGAHSGSQGFLNFTDVSITMGVEGDATQANSSYGLDVYGGGARANLKDSTIVTHGHNGRAINQWQASTVTLENVDLTTHGDNALGIASWNYDPYSGTGYQVVLNATDTRLTTTGAGSTGLYFHDLNGVGGISTAYVSASVSDSTVITQGNDALGARVQGRNVFAQLNNVDVTTSGQNAHALEVFNSGELTVTNSDILATGEGSSALITSGGSNGTFTPRPSGSTTYDTTPQSFRNKVTINGGTVTAEKADLIAATAAYTDIAVNNVTLNPSAGYNLATVSSYSLVALATEASLLTGRIQVDASSQATVALRNNSRFTGNINRVSTVLVQSGSEWNVTGSDDIVAGGQTTIAASATLSGTGTTGSSVLVQSGGFISPGNSPGTLTIQGDLDIFGTYLLELHSQTLGHDLIIVGGELDLMNGTLLGTDLTPFEVVTIGTIIPIIEFETFAGNYFVGLDEGAITTIGANNYVINYGTLGGYENAVTLTVTPVPEPSGALLIGLVGLRFITRRRR